MMGRCSIFREKEGGDRLQGLVTPIGSAAFERKRERLAAIVGRKPKDVSDGDTFEFLARGEQNTRAYLAGAVR